MNTGEIISHLHVEHDYVLVRCMSEDDDHYHTPYCFKLPESGFKTETDARLCHALLNEPMPLVALVEHRAAKIRKTQLGRIQKAAVAKPSASRSSARHAENLNASGSDI